jgi:PAS domain S-box-containing protein
MGPLYKFRGFGFGDAPFEEEGKAKLKAAISSARDHGSQPASRRVRNLEMLSLAADGGLPIRKHFDWTCGLGADGSVVLFGEPCSEGDVEQRARDSELVDFFQNAPIAMHWLSSEGIILWANQTELDVLGYTAEEYIGQSVMKFCPDEEALVLEIFKQLGSGNTIRDVPVRFRTKDGRIVDLLIDSNVK